MKCSQKKLNWKDCKETNKYLQNKSSNGDLSMKSITRILFHQKLQHLQPNQSKIAIRKLTLTSMKILEEWVDSVCVSVTHVQDLCEVLPLPLKTLKEMHQQRSPPKV